MKTTGGSGTVENRVPDWTINLFEAISGVKKLVMTRWVVFFFDFFTVYPLAIYTLGEVKYPSPISVRTTSIGSPLWTTTYPRAPPPAAGLRIPPPSSFNACGTKYNLGASS